jgi:ABC-type nitrate/sulfonate/bicarbonate transport system ATPase subunit
MTARPGKVKKIVEVDIPRPRDPNNEEISNIVRILWNELKDESRRMMEIGI